MPPGNEVKPFRGLYYNPDKISSIGDCLSQPYDVISPDQQDAYYRQHEYNVIRLILNRIASGDTEKNNRYTRARDHFADWKTSGILTRSDTRSFWIYEQEYQIPGEIKKRMRGLIGAVRLQEYTEGRILPHEKVMEGPISDRSKLALETNAQFESIWGFYWKKKSPVERLIDSAVEEKPLVDYREQSSDPGSSGVRHRFWRYIDREGCDIIERFMAETPVYIADGHHRYQTMLALRDRFRELHPNAGTDTPWEYIMMYLVNASSGQMTLLPYHRMLHGIRSFSWESIKNILNRSFDICRLHIDHAKDEELLKALKERKPHTFGAVVAGENTPFLFTLRDPERYASELAGPASDSWKLLDVNILNNLVLNQAVGITEEQLSRKTYVEYTPDPKEAVQKVRSGDMQAAFLMNPPDVDEIMSLSRRGEVLPRKSTFFYPKPLSGLVFYSMEGDRL